MPVEKKKQIISLSDLIDSKVVTAEGEKVGRVVDVQVTPHPPHEVLALICGSLGWLERLAILRPFIKAFGREPKQKNVPWEAVDRYENLKVYLKPGRQPEE
jgi:sporulation protein YlmC with PRC-barrel domain